MEWDEEVDEKLPTENKDLDWDMLADKAACVPAEHGMGRGGGRETSNGEQRFGLGYVGR